MRGSVGGRFSIDYERESILYGIDKDLQDPVGQFITWWRYDAENTVVDDLYDVGAPTGGRMWKDSFELPTVTAVVFQGRSVQNNRGLYNADTLRVTVNVKDVDALLPGLTNGYLNEYLLDRIIYRGQVYTPTRLYPRGLIVDKYTMLTFDANQVNPEELVNDSQFAQYAS